MDVSYLPTLVKGPIDDRIVVLIDALRMTSTIITAMANGLTTAMLFADKGDVFKKAAEFSPSDIILGGEKDRVLIANFHRDNSPLSYIKGVEKRTALFLTSNGTRGAVALNDAKILCLGSFLNVSGVIRFIQSIPDLDVLFVCSGTKNGTQRTIDDELCVFYLMKSLLLSKNGMFEIGPDSEAEYQVMDDDFFSWEEIRMRFRSSPGAAALERLLLWDDVNWCLHVDLYPNILPVYVRHAQAFLPYHVNQRFEVRQLAAKAMVTRSRGPVCIRVFVVAHGGWRWKLSGKRKGILGRSDVDTTLDEVGIERATAVAKLLQTENLKIIASSTTNRCVTTAELIRQHQKENEAVKIWQMDELRPLDFGDWAGLSVEEVQQRWPGDYTQWQNEGDFSEHGGESFTDLSIRVRQAMGHVLQRGRVLSGDDWTTQSMICAVCIVCHPSAIRCFVAGFQLSSSCGPQVCARAA